MYGVHHRLPGKPRPTACPVSRVNPSYPGPKQAGPDGERLRLKDGALYDDALKYCINCKRCEVACPSDVKIGDIIQRARAKYDTTRPSLRNFVLSHTDLMGSVSTPFAPIVNTATSLKPVRQLLDYALKIDHRRTLPKYSFGTFRRWYRSVAAQQAQYQDQVAFFHGCFVNYNHPQLGKDLIKVLNAMGTGVQLLSKEKCCGVPLIANGFTDKARKQAVSNVASLREAIDGMLDYALKIDHRRTLPKYSFGTFRRWYRSVAAQQAQYQDQVAFFHGCFVNYNHPQLGKDLIKVLNAMGTGVQLLSKEKCCGVPLIANGFTDKARKQAVSNVASLREAIDGKGIPVIATSSTCTFALRDEYPEVLDVDNSGLREHIELATRWLWRKLDEGKTLPLKTLPLKVVYHTPCHMEKMGWTLNAAAEGGLSHAMSHGENGLDALYAGATATNSRAGADGAGFSVLRDCRDLRL